MQKVDKGWGHELILIANEMYCLKRMVFTEKGNFFSMHYHAQKHESWIVESGSFELVILNLQDASEIKHIIKENDSITIAQGVCHQLFALEDNSVILEVSTADSPEDNYRIRPGMSQGAK